MITMYGCFWFCCCCGLYRWQWWCQQIFHVNWIHLTVYQCTKQALKLCGDRFLAEALQGEIRTSQRGGNPEHIPPFINCLLEHLPALSSYTSSVDVVVANEGSSFNDIPHFAGCGNRVPSGGVVASTTTTTTRTLTSRRFCLPTTALFPKTSRILCK